MDVDVDVEIDVFIEEDSQDGEQHRTTSTAASVSLATYGSAEPAQATEENQPVEWRSLTLVVADTPREGAIEGEDAIEQGADLASFPSQGIPRSTCTAPQLRRFIKSRAYVPMHELRRRFSINGDDDEVTAVWLGDGRVFVGLPQREGRLLGDLLRQGEVGYELSLDPASPIVVGVYPMRPVPRP